MKMETRGKAIDKIYKRRDRIDMPDFQREEVWPESKKRLLIDSILKEWHLPKFYFRKLDDGSFECVDGQQRLSAIFEFFEDQLALDEDTAKKAGGNKYSQLDDDISDAFDDFEIDIEEIEGATEEELEELFRRLQLGTPLNTAEKINAITGELRDFCHDMADKPFFENKIGLKDTRYTHFETIVKWAFVESRGIQPQMRYPQLESLLRENKTFSKSSDTAKRINGALHFLSRAFPEKCSAIRNRANTLSICMLAGRAFSRALSSDEHAKDFRAFIESFFLDLSAEVEKGVKAVDKELLRYQQAITSGSTSGESIGTRINILTKRLATFSPRFATLLGTFPGASDEVERNIGELAGSARDIIYEINRKYAASHGEDLFKMTTKSAKALTTIATTCRDSNQYEKFIDALYFLIYEGSGACNRLPKPPDEFVMDIKYLRTAIRHDTDHGDAKSIKEKNKRAGAIFQKFSGKKTPEECGSEELLAMQVRILRGLLLFLTTNVP
jgi:hypothetical protein